MENVIQTPPMSFGEALKTCFKKYATFSGRARRSEFWWFSVLPWLLSLAMYGIFWWKLAKVSEIESKVAEVMFDEEKLNALKDQAAGYDSTFMIVMVVLGIIGLLLLLPGLAVSVRRLHDTGKTGFWLIGAIIPIVNFVVGIILLIFYLKDGDRGVNKYGPSPKYIVQKAPEPEPRPRYEPRYEPPVQEDVVEEAPEPEPEDPQSLYNKDNKLSI